jgi:putative LysE/RhtB family amino acid efflux pump
MHPVLVGFGLGFLVALQVGPMTLFLIRSTLRSGWVAGLAVGAGIGVVDGLYAAAGAAGVTPLLSPPGLRLVLGLVGAAVLLVLGLRTLRDAFRVRLGGESDFEVATVRRTFLTALAGTASNPLTIASWAAIFAAANASGAVQRTGLAEVLLVSGVTVGSACWGTLLASAIALVRRRVGERALAAAEVVAGLGLVGFGGALGYATVHER